MTKEFKVEGMNCGHCASRVEKAVVAKGFAAMVDLPAKTLSVTADGPIDDAAVAKAVEDAGYRVVP